MLFILLRNPCRPGKIRLRRGEFLGLLDALLQFANGGEIFVEFVPVGIAEFRLQPAGVFGHEVEDALVVEIAFCAVLFGFPFDAVGEKPVEDQARINLRRHRRRFGFPGEIELIGATVARIAFAGDAALVTAQFERGQARESADFFSGNLVHRNAGLDIRALGLARLTAGEEGGGGPGVVAGPVAVRTGLVVRQTADDLEILLERFHRLEDVRQFIIGSDGLRRPVLHVRAVRNVNEGHAAREGSVGFGCACGQQFRWRQHGFKHWQGNNCSQPFQEGPSWNLPGPVHKFFFAG